MGVGASPIPLDQTNAITVSDSDSSQSLYDRKLGKRGKKHPDSSTTPKTPTIETDPYKAVANIGKNLQLNKYYAFYITNTLKSPPVKEEAPSCQWGMKAAWLPAHLLCRR